MLGHINYHELRQQYQAKRRSMGIQDLEDNEKLAYFNATIFIGCIVCCLAMIMLAVILK